MSDLKLPQARVLNALMACDDGANPVLSRMQLAENAGFVPTSGTINGALHGIADGSSTGKPHMGLIDLGYVSRLPLDVDGAVEIHYQITSLGIEALEKYLSDGGKLPPVRDKAASVNRRYKK